MILFAQNEPVDGALAMAIDEILLERAGEPLLRTWHWAETTYSIGCFVRMEEVRVMLGPGDGEVPVIRRWSGGGCVLHEKGYDFSYSLVYPRGSAEERLRPVESYRRIHARVAAALGACGIEAALSGGGDAGGMARDCFRCPVPFDLVDPVTGAKISGAGQKRTRRGLLHQGNIRAEGLGSGFPRILADAMASDVRVEALDEELLAAAEFLRTKKYASADWTEKY